MAGKQPYQNEPQIINAIFPSWDYWTRDNRRYPETKEAMAVLEEVLARNPMHPGAIHLYIHVVEYARPQPSKHGLRKRGGTRMRT